MSDKIINMLTCHSYHKKTAFYFDSQCSSSCICVLYCERNKLLAIPVLRAIAQVQTNCLGPQVLSRKKSEIWSAIFSAQNLVEDGVTDQVGVMEFGHICLF